MLYKTEEACLKLFNMSFDNFIEEYYFKQNLSLSKLANMLQIKRSTLAQHTKKNNIDLNKLLLCKYCKSSFKQKVPTEVYCSKQCGIFAKNRLFNNLRAKNVIKRGYKRKEDLIAKFGGKCSVCGHSKLDSLSFHHLDPTKKEFSLNRMILGRKSINKVLLEVNKCQLLCCNCHFIIHEKEINKRYKTGKIRQSAINRRQVGMDIKKKLIDSFGGQCDICNFKSKYCRCFSFHHLDRSNKSFHLSIPNLVKYSNIEINNEIKKCQLLCINCHMEIERKIFRDKSAIV